MIRSSAAVVGIAALWPMDVAAMPSERDPWQLLQAGRLRVYSELSPRETKEIFERVRDFEADVFAPGRAIVVPDAGTETNVFLFRKKSELDEYQTLGWDALAWDTRERRYVLMHQERWEDALPTALSMQCVQNLTGAYSHVPPWAAQGLAHFYATYRRKGGDVIVGDEAPEWRTRLQESAPLPWERIWEIGSEAPEIHGQEQSVFEAQSWLLVHYLIVGTGKGEESVARFLASLEQGALADEAFAASFGFQPTEIAARMNEYRKRGGYSTLHFAAPPAPEEREASFDAVPYPVLLVELAEMAATLSATADLDLGEQRRAVAARHLESAQAAHAGTSDIERGLGVVALAADDFDEAANHLRRAIAADSSDVRARFLLAQSILQRRHAQTISTTRPFGKDVPADIQEARAQLRRVLQARKPLVEARVLFGLTYLYDPGDAAPGLSALTSLLRMFPGRSDIRQAVVLLSLRSGDVASGLDTALGGRPDDRDTWTQVSFVVDQALWLASDSVKKEPARAKELTDLVLSHFERDALTATQNAKLAEIEGQLRSAASGR